jgi:hypothetical protein
VKSFVRFLAEVVKLCEGETDPEDAENAGNALVEMLMKGVLSGETAPFTAKVLSAAPLVDTVTFPDKEDAAVVEATRIVIVAGTTDPLDRAIVRGKEVYSPVVLISNPAGGVTVRSPNKLYPETMKICSPEGEPEVVEKEFNEPLVYTTGPLMTDTLILTSSILQLPEPEPLPSYA